MKPDPITCIHLAPGAVPPEINFGPSRWIVVVEADVSQTWQTRVSEWMVRSGCLYMMAWGRDGGSWDDAVDWVNLDKFDFTSIPDDEFVMTTWHDDELLQEVFWYSKLLAQHPSVDLTRTIILDISIADRSEELLSLYEAA